MILFPIKSPVASAAFWVTLFELVLGASVADCLEAFGCIYKLSFFIFLPTVLAIFLANDKNPQPFYKYYFSRLS